MLRVFLVAVAGAALGRPLAVIIAAYARPPATALVAAPAAGSFALLAVKVSAPLALVAFCWVAGAGVALGYVDAARQRLPDRLTVSALAGALAFLAADALVAGRPAALCSAVLSGLATGGFYAVLVVLNPAGMGAGDAKLALSVGTVLGRLGYAVAFLGVLAGFALAAGYAAILLCSGRIARRDRLAHGPFMLIGALLAIVVAG